MAVIIFLLLPSASYAFVSVETVGNAAIPTAQAVLMAQAEALAAQSPVQAAQPDPVSSMPTQKGLPVGRLAFGMFAVAGLMGGSFLIMKKFMGSRGILPTNQRLIRIISSAPLGMKSNVVLVDVAGENFLIGVSDGKIELLDRIEGKIDAAAPQESAKKDKVDFSKVQQAIIKALKEKGRMLVGEERPYEDAFPVHAKKAKRGRRPSRPAAPPVTVAAVALAPRKAKAAAPAVNPALRLLEKAEMAGQVVKPARVERPSRTAKAVKPEKTSKPENKPENYEEAGTIIDIKAKAKSGNARGAVAQAVLPRMQEDFDEIVIERTSSIRPAAQRNYYQNLGAQIAAKAQAMPDAETLSPSALALKEKIDRMRMTL
jgi:flagellar biogenesis protein FliO